MEETKKICDIVRQQENDYINGSTTISKYVDFNMHENIEKIDAYLNSKHISGSQDSMGREKPFFNIVTAAVNIWYRATDIDRKDIKLNPTKQSDTFEAFLATLHLQDWMRRERFGSFLNDWGRSLSRYGSTVLKFVETSDELNCQVVPWNRLIVDPVDFDNAPVIEILELTPAQLKQRKGYDKEMVDSLIENLVARETIGKEKKDTRIEFIKVYEVHGNLPLSLLTERDEDDDIYCQQMHVVTFVGKKQKGLYDDYTLLKGKEKKNPYMITHLIKEDGRTQSIGAVENLFEAQWMTNHTSKQIKDQLDLASKLIFQTSDGNFVGQNALNSIETGDILVHSVNQPLTQLANSSHDITSLQNYGQQWQTIGKEINGISEAMQGVQKSGTAWRQTEALLQESHSLFEMMVENKGNHIDDMMRWYVIPYIKSKMDTTKELVATLSSHQLQKIDIPYIRNMAIKSVNAKIKDALLNNTPLPDTNLLREQEAIKIGLAEQGNTRSFSPSDIKEKTWKDVLKDLEWSLEIDVTGEQKDKQAVMTTLTTVFANIQARQGRPMSPEEKFIFNKILEETGAVSSMELASIPADQTQPQQSVSPSGQGSVSDMSKLQELTK
ncbi:MAG: hypothetical protein HGA35_04625 [Erysipelotrichaceae bacterium]|nr:hypothetical protein [Erysipelotrichaceae bacterium]